MRLAEIFYSVQGEGVLTGVPSVFVRTTGCNLRCQWCDSPYTSWEPEGETFTLDAILAEVARHPARHVVLTGGEPLLQPDIVPLSEELRRRGYHVTVETAATVFRPVACDLASLSPKLSNSTPTGRDGGRFALRHDALRQRPDVIAAFMARGEYQLKFVVDRPEDLDEIRDLLAQLPAVPPERVLLMPEGVSTAALNAKALWLVDLCKAHGYRYCPRLHVDLFGNRRGT